MANIEKYKEQARKYEAKEQWGKALEPLLKAIDAMERSPEEDADLSLYNRVGDLYIKTGETSQAVVYYERAAEKYGDAGFHNNAIALCNKVLRLSPGRSSVYLRLGMLFAAKGFTAEARQNLLEYADRMQRAGQLEEAFKALKAFAEMTPGQDDIWGMLAQQAKAAARTKEQREQVDRLLAEFEQKDRVAQRKTRASRSQITGEELPEEPVRKRGELVFLDLDEEPSRPSGAAQAVAEPPRAAPEPPRAAAPAPPPAAAEEPPLVIERTTFGFDSAAPAAPPLEIEPTSLVEPGGELDLEPTTLTPEPEAPPAPPPPPRQKAAPPEPPPVEELPVLEEEEAEPDAGLPLLEVGEGAEPPAGATAATLDFVDLGEVIEEVPSVEDLEAMLALSPEDWNVHRRLGEVLLDEGQRERGLQELDAALSGFEGDGELHEASAVTEEILRLDPNSVRHQQKRVELAFRKGDRAALVDAYNELGDALLRNNEPSKAVAVYQRVLEHDADNARARAALETLAPPEEEPAAPAASAAPAKGAPAGGAFVDLGEMLLGEEAAPKDTRMRVEDEEPTGDEEADFQSMLAAFKRGIAANVGEEDFQSHYDLGVAYKEMGLLDEAIAEFQKALRSSEGRLMSSEALGMCFFEKKQFAVAETILKRGVEAPAVGDAERIGLLYWLGRSLEEQERVADALTAYNRVFAVDITFKDVSDRVRALHGRAGA